MPVFPERLALAVILELRRQNSLDVFWFRGQDNPFSNTRFNRISSRPCPLIEQLKPHIVRLIFQRIPNNFIRDVQPPWYIALPNGRPSTKFANSATDADLFCDSVDDKEQTQASKEVQCRHLSGYNVAHCCLQRRSEAWKVLVVRGTTPRSEAPKSQISSPWSHSKDISISHPSCRTSQSSHPSGPSMLPPRF